MSQLSPATNPFLLMMDPQAVLSRVECSERLARLHRRVCHPLDRPSVPAGQFREAVRHDRAVDESDARIEGEIDEQPGS